MTQGGHRFRVGEPVLIDGQPDPYGTWRFGGYLREGWAFIQVEHGGQTDGSQVELARLAPVMRAVT